MHIYYKPVGNWFAGCWQYATLCKHVRVTWRHMCRALT